MSDEEYGFSSHGCRKGRAGLASNAARSTVFSGLCAPGLLGAICLKLQQLQLTAAIADQSISMSEKVTSAISVVKNSQVAVCGFDLQRAPADFKLYLDTSTDRRLLIRFLQTRAGIIVTERNDKVLITRQA